MANLLLCLVKVDQGVIVLREESQRRRQAGPPLGLGHGRPGRRLTWWSVTPCKAVPVGLQAALGSSLLLMVSA